MKWIIGVGVVLLVILMGWFIGAYNNLARRRIRAENSLSQIDVQLKRRCDLIPNLVEAVKGYMTHERATLEAVTAARSRALDGLNALHGAPRDGQVIRALASSSGAIDLLLGRLAARIEAYPDLKANTSVLALQEELSSTENRIAFARQAYNDAVAEFNMSIAVFPSNLVARTMGFVDMALFEASESDRVVPSAAL